MGKTVGTTRANTFRQLLAKDEERIMFKNREHAILYKNGKPVFQKIGDEKSVEFEDWEAEKFRGGGFDTQSPFMEG